MAPVAPKPDYLTQEIISVFTQRSAWSIRRNTAEIQSKIKELPDDIKPNLLAPVADSLSQSPDAARQRKKKFKVGIIGAGCAGLFTAMLFDHLKANFGLDVEYEILEANDSDRVGGRLFTYEFPPRPKEQQSSKDKIEREEKKRSHDYYDVGAMRFPENHVMKRTFALFNILGMKKFNPSKEEKKQNPNLKPEPGNLIRYWMNGVNIPMLYNSRQVITQPQNPEGFATANKFDITDLPDLWRHSNTSHMISYAISEFTEKYKRNKDEGEDQRSFWEHLQQVGDKYSVRQWFSKFFEYNTIEWLETYNFGNRWYDQALSELVLEELDFKARPEDWWCVEGGAQQIAHEMHKKISDKDSIKWKTAVRKMAYTREPLTDENGKVDPNKGTPKNVKVWVNDEQEARTYDAVFNSAPLGAMQHMQLEGLNLNYGTKQAIRSLGYGASCKVGIRFKKLWWIEEPYCITEGGVAKTDLPLRCCVYPSYNKDDPVKDGGVLLCSYTWSQEAERIGALISRDSPNNESELKALLLNDLARLHTNNDNDYEKLLEDLNELYIDHYAHNWYSDKHQVGAFAYFGPSQYSEMQKYITRSDGKHIIVGEAASAHHAWVVGALESVVRGMFQFAFRHSGEDSACDRIARCYALPEHDKDRKESLPEPFGPLPYEYDRAKDVEYMDENKLKPAEVRDIVGDVRAVKSSPNGDLARSQVLFEMERQMQGTAKVDGEKISEFAVKLILQAQFYREHPEEAVAAPPVSETVAPVS